MGAASAGLRSRWVAATAAARPGPGPGAARPRPEPEHPTGIKFARVIRVTVIRVMATVT